MSDVISSIQSQIAELQVKLDRERERLSKLTPTQQIADRIHSTTCFANHVEGCSWEYEKWENVNQSHAKKRYLKKAEKVEEIVKRENISVDTVFEIFDAMR